MPVSWKIASAQAVEQSQECIAITNLAACIEYVNAVFAGPLATGAGRCWARTHACSSPAKRRRRPTPIYGNPSLKAARGRAACIGLPSACRDRNRRCPLCSRYGSRRRRKRVTAGVCRRTRPARRGQSLQSPTAVELLRSVGLAVDVAEDGKAAVEAAERGNDALILMEIQMPRRDGLAATRKIRENPAFATAAPRVEPGHSHRQSAHRSNPHEQQRDDAHGTGTCLPAVPAAGRHTDSALPVVGEDALHFVAGTQNHRHALVQ